MQSKTQTRYKNKINKKPIKTSTKIAATTSNNIDTNKNVNDNQQQQQQNNNGSNANN